MSHKISKDLRKAFPSQKTVKPRFAASPTAEIRDTRLESSVGKPRVSGDDEEIQQNNTNDSQDENEKVEQAEVVW